jgi:hypothetical protein
MTTITIPTLHPDQSEAFAEENPMPTAGDEDAIKAPPPFSQRDSALAAYLGAGQHPATFSKVQKRIIELEKKTGMAA